MNLRTAALLLSGFAAGFPAYAQEGNPPEATADVIPVAEPPEPEPPREEAAAFDDLVITATRREESVRDIAGSVAAFTGAQLEELGARGQEDFADLVPGVSFFKGEPNQNRISIRGIAADYGTSQSTGILIGDVPFTDPFVADQTPDLVPFDLQTVEVLKGPQGTLFGASGLGGSLRYVLEPAQLSAWSARGFVAFDQLAYGGREPTYGAALNAPLFHDTLALRVVGTERRRPGTIDETGRGEADIDRSRTTSLRALLRHAPTDRLDVQAIHLAQETSVDDQGFVENLEGRLERDSTPTASPGISNFAMDTLTVGYDLGWGRLVSATGRAEKVFGTRTDSNRLAPGTRVDAYATVDGYTQELRLVSAHAAAWRWLAGAFWMRYDNFRRVDLFGDTVGQTGRPLPNVPFVPGPVAVTGDDTGLVARFDLDASAEELALFGEVTRAFAEGWDVTVGLRGYRTESAGVATASGPLNLVLAGEPESRNDAVIREDDLNPKLALRWRLNDAILLYALTSRGFRFGGISLIADTQTDDVPATFKSDSIWLYELGLRTTLQDPALVADLSVYRIDWKDPQLTQLTDSGLLLYTENAGGAGVLGADAAVRYRTLLDGLTVGMAAAYTDARTTEAFMAASGAQVPEGARWPFTPDRQLAVEASYVRFLGAWPLSATATYALTGKGVANIENTIPVFDYSILDARIDLGAATWPGAPVLALLGGNLLDERGVAARTDADAVRTIYYARPRAVTLQLTVAF